MPRVIRAYEKEGTDIAARWHASNKANRKAEKAKSKEENSSDIRRQGYSKPRTNTEFDVIIGVNDIPDCPKKFEYGKPYLPDWALSMVPSEIQRMHSWYMRACRFGLRDLWERYPPDVFRTKLFLRTLFLLLCNTFLIFL